MPVTNGGDSKALHPGKENEFRAMIKLFYEMEKLSRVIQQPQVGLFLSVHVSSSYGWKANQVKTDASLFQNKVERGWEAGV